MHSASVGFFGALTPLLGRYGYLALFGIVGIESFGIPAPGQSILIAAAVYAGTGRLDLPLVALVAFLAATIGDNVGYTIGRFGGRRLVRRVGRYVGLTDRRMGRLQDRFERHGGKLVVGARFVDGLRQFNGVLSGMAEMRWTSFLGYNALGAALWVLIWTSVGHFAGHHLAAIYEQVRRYQFLAVAVLVVVAGALLARHLSRRRRTGCSPTNPG